jgi:EmrB/QacA subfamily drug resistance transporter
MLISSHVVERRPTIKKAAAVSVKENLAAKPSAKPERKPNIVLAFLAIAGFMVFLDVSIVNVALPSIQAELGLSEANLQYIVTAYGTVLGGFLMLSGRLSDRLGRRRLLQIGLIVFALASGAGGFAQSAEMLIVSRAVQGLGSALIAPAALGILTSTFSEGKERNKALGVWGALGGIAAVVGVVAGGLLTEGPGWRWIFFINVPIGLIAAALAPLILPESRSVHSAKRFDIAGGVALTAALLLLIFTLGQTFNSGWLSLQTLGGGAGVIVLAVAFFVIERRSSVPLVSPRVLRLPTVRASNIVTLLMFGTLVTLFFFASLFMQQVLHYSPIQTGLGYVPLALIVALGAGLASNLVHRVGARPVLLVGLLLATTGMLLLSSMPADASYPLNVLPVFLLVGLGLGLSFVPLQVTAFAGVTEHDSGITAGLINTSQEAGGALGVAVAATIAFSRLHELTVWAHGDPARVEIARTTVFHTAFFVGACFAAMSFMVAALLLGRKNKTV